jgi:hypothetical protein
VNARPAATLLLSSVGMIWNTPPTKSRHSIHDLRRSPGFWAAMTGASSLVIGKALGHLDPSSTAIYARLNLDPVRVAVDAATGAMQKVVDVDRHAQEPQGAAEPPQHRKWSKAGKAQAGCTTSNGAKTLEPGHAGKARSRFR